MHVYGYLLTDLSALFCPRGVEKESDFPLLLLLLLLLFIERECNSCLLGVPILRLLFNKVAGMFLLL